MDAEEELGPDPIDIAVGARVRARRHALGLSQTQLAETLGITFQQVQKYEKGKNRISASVLVRAAARLDTTVQALVGEEDIPITDTIVPSALFSPTAIELLQAFGRIDDPRARRAFLALATVLSGAPDGAAEIDEG
jgi:transcriptional regulator with XRE-family HTH domain